MKSRLILIVLALMLVVAGCRKKSEVTVSPSPVATTRPSASPTVSLEPAVSPTGGITSPGPGTGDIPGFNEGNIVDQEQVPEIVAAVKKQYPDATITSVTHSTYLDRQTYLVTLSGTGDGVVELHVTADGTILENQPVTSPQ